MKTEIIKAISAKYKEEYKKAQKKRKKEILDSLIEIGGMHRKSAIRLLNRPYKQAQKKGRKQGKSKYSYHTKRLIKQIWKLSGEICAERLFPMIEEDMNALQVAGKVRGYSKEEITIVKSISLGSLKLVVRTFPHTRHFHSSFKHKATKLYKQIPISVDFGKHTQPGYVEVDFVEHCGSSAAGRFCCSMCLSDVATGWTTHAACLGKDKQALTQAITKAKTRMYHKVQEYHPDNNFPLLASLFDNSINLYALSRSRPYHKNDNAHVEQKNGDQIRGWVGYFRYDRQEQSDLLNHLYEVLDLYLNFFIPSQKLIRSFRDERGKVIKKEYDAPQTPYQRLLQSSIPDTKKRQLRKMKTQLSISQLKQDIDSLQKLLHVSLR